MEPVGIGAIVLATIALIGLIVTKVADMINRDEQGKLYFKSNCCVFGTTLVPQQTPEPRRRRSH